MAATLTSDTPLAETRSEIVHTRIALEFYPYFGPELGAFQAFELGYETLLKNSLVLGDAVLKTRFDVKHCDIQLNTIVDEVARRLNDIADEGQRELVRASLFGKKKPSAFRKPMLGAQLKSMGTWPTTLAALPIDSLKSYAPVVQGAIDKALLAEKALADAVAAEKHFYTLGEYRSFLDPLNAARNELEGKAEAYRHANPSLNLPRDFGHLFFRARQSHDDPSSAELLEEAAELEAKAGTLKMHGPVISVDTVCPGVVRFSKLGEVGEDSLRELAPRQGFGVRTTQGGPTPGVSLPNNGASLPLL